MTYVALTRNDTIPVKVLQEALKYHDLARVACALGWVRPDRDAGNQIKGDGSRLARTIGLRPSYTYKGRVMTQETVRVELAGRILQAAGLYPVDYGI